MKPYEHTESVAIELSNTCSHAWLHEKCPLHLEAVEPGLMQAPVTLPLKLAVKVLEDLGKHDYKGQLAFHQYNEPLQDPRLFYLLDMAGYVCPNAEVYILTNGYNLTAELAEELFELGVKKIGVSVMGSANVVATMSKRVALLRGIYGDAIEWNPEHVMDDRLTLYDIPRPDPDLPCYAPLRHVVVNRDGKVGLCCFDWKRVYTFGDLREQELSEILVSEDMQNLYAELSKGNRCLNLCRQCDRSR